MSAVDLTNPVLNSPYAPPERHFELGPDGPTGEVVDGRRPSESFIPVPRPKKGTEQQTLDFDLTGERREKNSLINDIRFEVERWRARGYPGVTPITRKLLLHWSAGPPEREEPVFFCQREAAETAIFLAEVAGRGAQADYRTRIDPENERHNSGLRRVGIKMATGTGKTVVMAMLISWQTLNKVATPNDARFAKRFLVVTPGITIRDRLRVLDPTDSGNYYDERDLVPADLKLSLLQAQVVITNYHSFLLRDVKEVEGVASNTKKILAYGKRDDPFKETEDQMVTRVLRDFVGRGKGEIVVLNDEAHHCYQDKPLDDDVDFEAGEKKEAEQRNADARVWFKGLLAVNRKVGIKSIYDLSATPYYLSGSGYMEGYIFPWVVSDFSLMDAIESGIVKVPRVPVDDDAAGDLVTYLRLWDYVGPVLPKKKTAKLDDTTWVPPKELEGALRSLYRSYERRYGHWQRDLEHVGETPPVMIVVCPNTIVSKLVYDWIAGRDIERDDGTIVAKSGELPLLANVEEGLWTPRPRTILIDSAQLESGEVMGRDFKQAAAQEIEIFKRDYLRRNPGADEEKITNEDLLREVMNTVGKKGRLGEHIRCVVSVAMLTEGWDANTVTHILGIRRFGSQLLCEQVVGRGLRRRSYAVNEEGLLDAEYAEVYGVPFAFIPGRPQPDPKPRPPAVEVYALLDRAELEINFPKLDGYRIEIPDEQFLADFSTDCQLHISRSEVPTWIELEGVVGKSEEQVLDELREARVQHVAYQIAKLMLESDYADVDRKEKPWLFPQLVDISRRWLDECVTCDDGVGLGMLLLAEGTHLAKERLVTAILRVEGDRQPRLLPIFRPFDSEGSTENVHFFTRKVVIDATRSHVNRVVLDGPHGNTWEQIVAEACEAHEDVHSYVKNDHLGFSIPYVHEGRTYQYVPDFLVRLRARDEEDEVRTLVVEVSGGRKSVHSPGSVQAKAETARYQWCAAVNNHGGYGRWDYVEIKDKKTAPLRLDEAIEELYTSEPRSFLQEV